MKTGRLSLGVDPRVRATGPDSLYPLHAQNFREARLKFALDTASLLGRGFAETLPAPEIGAVVGELDEKIAARHAR